MTGRGRGRGRGKSSLVPKNLTPDECAATDAESTENRLDLSAHGRRDIQNVEIKELASTSSNSLNISVHSASPRPSGCATEYTAASQHSVGVNGRMGRGRGRPLKSPIPDELPDVGGLALDARVQDAQDPVHLQLRMAGHEPPGTPGSGSAAGSMCGDDGCRVPSDAVSNDSGFVPVSTAHVHRFLHVTFHSLRKELTQLLYVFYNLLLTLVFYRPLRLLSQYLT